MTGPHPTLAAALAPFAPKTKPYAGVFDRLGYAAIGLYAPKTDDNVGGALRAAKVFGAKLIAIHAPRIKNHGTNTTATHRHVPIVITDDLLAARPWQSRLVVVEVDQTATYLDEFEHPESAFYVFGPEDGSVPKAISEKAQHKVVIRGWHCVNLAVAVNLVLHDRVCKRGLG